MKTGLIRTRTAILGIVPTLVTFLLTTAYFVNARLTDVETELQKRGELMVSQLAPASEFGVVIGDSQLLGKLVDSVMKDEDLSYIRINNSAGVTLVYRQKGAGNNPENIIEFHADIIQQALSLDEMNDALAIENNAASKARRIGDITIGLSKQNASNRQQEIIRVAFILGCAALLLSSLIAALISRSISVPIQRLSRIVRKIRDGDLKQYIPPVSGGELGMLEDDVNAMSESLMAAQSLEQERRESLERAKQAAESANRAKGQFLANVSHELRTPMNGTLGMLQLLHETQLTPYQKEFVQTANESTEHLIRIINDILDFSKIEDGKLILESVWFNPEQLIKRSLNAFRSEARLRDIELISEMAGDQKDAEVLGDPTRIRQILVNLIGNAVKFTLAGHVRVRAVLESKTPQTLDLNLYIEDTGIGIAEEKQAMIFDAFTQADGTTTRRHGGTGLGLSICRQLVHLMHGEIRVKSRENVGSVFSIHLPLRYRSQSLNPPVVETKNVAQAISGKILLVEDNVVNQAVTRGMVKLLGLDVDTASNGAEALSILENTPYDLILMDCQMPIMDGFEATRKLRLMDSGINKQTPIIALTANAMHGDKERCIEAGMDDYLAKPINREQLNSTVVHWLTRHVRPSNS